MQELRPFLKSKDEAMWNMNDVIKITYKRDYVFHVKFDDGVAGELISMNTSAKVLFLSH